MATRDQAKALKAAGFKVWARAINPGAPVGKLKRPTLKWIVENLSVEKAGFILRTLRNTDPKQSWNVKLPRRPFAEVNKNDVHEEMVKSLNQSNRRKR